MIQESIWHPRPSWVKGSKDGPSPSLYPIFPIQYYGMFRTHTVEQLVNVPAGTRVTLAGWVHRRRDHGPLIFIDLRNRRELVQVVIREKDFPEDKRLELKEAIRPETVIQLAGVVQPRKAGSENPNLLTGTIEILAQDITILNPAQTPAFEVDGDTMGVNEEVRLKYRYLDLRSPRLQRNVEMRHKVVAEIRRALWSQDFFEIETPNLSKSTPEGARDYLVPSRFSPGSFYALPQSPQQYKQLLMVGGVERYFQIARCFRDEDTRGDRQPEFTQLDLEMSFAEQEDIVALTEKLLIDIVTKLFPEKRIQQVPFPRIDYADAMRDYGIDRPDLREDKNDPDLLAFCWVVNFPFFEKTEGGGWTFTHNPFSAPIPEHQLALAEGHMAYEKGDDAKLEQIIAAQYDVVLNGFEIGGGSLRNNNELSLMQVFQILGYPKEQIMRDFGHMLEAFTYGAPPHGGIAWGLDRLLAILLNEPNIREVIAFPKTGDGRDPMMEAPSEVSSKQLQELHIKVAP